MRNSIFAVFAVLAVAGCGDGGGTKLDGGRDMTGGNADLSQAPADLTPVVKVGCKGYVVCVNDCIANSTTQAEFDTCKAQTCDKMVSMKGLAAYSAGIRCGQNWCLGTNDMGTGDCVLNAAMTSLEDPPGSPMNTCSNCLNNALAGLFGDTCMPLNDKNCNPTTCQATYAACQASTP